MTREEAEKELMAEKWVPLTEYPEEWEWLVTERLARREAEARVKELEGELEEANDYLKELKFELMQERMQNEP